MWCLMMMTVKKHDSVREGQHANSTALLKRLVDIISVSIKNWNVLYSMPNTYKEIRVNLRSDMQDQ